jgi:hypothetical protein
MFILAFFMNQRYKSITKAFTFIRKYNVNVNENG